MNRVIFLGIALLLSVTAPACSPNERNTIGTQVSGQVQTSVAGAQTMVPTLQTQAAGAIQTTVYHPTNTLQAGTPSSATVAVTGTLLTPEPNLLLDSWVTTLTAPFDGCETVSNHTESAAAGSREIFENGFSSASATCDAKTGVINSQVLVFGGKNGNIFSEADQVADASGAVQVLFVPPFSGDLKIEATVLVDGELGAAAGSATASPDWGDAILVFAPLDDMLETFYSLAKGLVLNTFAGVRTDITLTVEQGEKVERASALAHGQGASFPVPPWSGTSEIDAQETTVSMTVPVREGEPVNIRIGLSSNAKSYGWATAYWNLRGAKECSVTQVVLSQVK